MKRFLSVLGVLVALVVVTNPADAQLKFGVHGATIASVDEVLVAGQNVNVPSGTYGVGARAMIDPPLLPVALVGSYTKYFPDDGELWTGTLAAQLRLPLPVLKPYVTAGYQLRPEDLGGNSQNGFMVGAGLQLGFTVSLFLEGGFELGKEIDPADLAGLASAIDTHRIVVQGGLLFGG